MLTFKDCLDYCGLTEEEVRSIADRERMDGIYAIAFAHNLSETRERGSEARHVLFDRSIMRRVQR